jgi:hypothetical protein
MKVGKLPKRQYTQEFKAQAVRLAVSVGGHEAARRLGVPMADEHKQPIGPSQLVLLAGVQGQAGA